MGSMEARVGKNLATKNKNGQRTTAEKD